MTGQPSKKFINSVLNSRDWNYHKKRIALGISPSGCLKEKSGKKAIFKKTIKHYYSGPPSQTLQNIILNKKNSN